MPSYPDIPRLYEPNTNEEILLFYLTRLRQSLEDAVITIIQQDETTPPNVTVRLKGVVTLMSGTYSPEVDVFITEPIVDDLGDIVYAEDLVYAQRINPL